MCIRDRVSTAGLGITAAVYKMAQSIVEENGVFSYLGEFIFNVASKIIAAAFTLVGIKFDPILLFIAPFALILILTIFQLALTWFIYSLADIKSLSGERGGLKNTMFVLAGVGSVITVFNLFPLIFLWMIIVWMYPK